MKIRSDICLKFKSIQKNVLNFFLWSGCKIRDNIVFLFKAAKTKHLNSHITHAADNIASLNFDTIKADQDLNDRFGGKIRKSKVFLR